MRLWNYASGTPTDAQITLKFSELNGGFLLPAEADPVHPADIDRLFISLVEPDYAPGGTTPFATSAAGWAELSEISCQGHKPMLELGDVMVPPHGLAGIRVAAPDSQGDTHRHGQPADLCDICLVSAISGIGVASAPPTVAAPAASTRLTQTFALTVLAVAAPALSFRSRAPPIA